MFGVTYGERSHTTAFTERGANLYTNVTIVWSGVEESDLCSKFRRLVYSPLYERQYLVEVPGLEPRMTQSKCVVLPLHYTSIDCLVPPPRIEQGSYALQASAMTTFAKAAIQVIGGEYRNRTDQAICLQSKSGYPAHPPMFILYHIETH